MKNSPKGTKNTTKKEKKTKATYKITNWREYNKALIQRGSLNIWISKDVEASWYGNGRHTYSDQCIETLLTVQALYHLPLRATIGLVRSLFDQAGILLDVPDYTTVSRRAQKLSISLKKTSKPVTDLILDSTGAKIYGEGEWKVKKHGWTKHRTWKKIHLGVDSTGEIRAVEVTNKDTHDSTVTTAILDQEKAIITDFYGDGAYDTKSVYWALLHRDVTGFHIPPRRDAKVTIHGNKKRKPWPRDENLRAIRRTSRKRWKEESGYHIRSLGETAMFRFKAVFGGHLSARTDASQRNEVLTKCNLLNAFHSLGMPQTALVT